MNSYYMLSFVVDGFFMMTSFVIWSFCKHTVLHFGHTAAYSLQFHTNRFFLFSSLEWIAVTFRANGDDEKLRRTGLHLG